MVTGRWGPFAWRCLALGGTKHTDKTHTLAPPGKAVRWCLGVVPGFQREGGRKEPAPVLSIEAEEEEGSEVKEHSNGRWRALVREGRVGESGTSVCCREAL